MKVVNLDLKQLDVTIFTSHPQGVPRSFSPSPLFFLQISYNCKSSFLLGKIMFSFSTRSIRQSFLIQLIFASASLIFIFSSLLYFYIERSIFEEKHQELLSFAKNIAHNESIYGTDIASPEIYLGVNIEIIHLKRIHQEGDLYETTKNKKTPWYCFYGL